MPADIESTEKGKLSRSIARRLAGKAKPNESIVNSLRKLNTGELEELTGALESYYHYIRHSGKEWLATMGFKEASERL